MTSKTMDARSTRRALRAIAAAAALLCAAPAAAQDVPEGRVEATRTTLEKWIETRRLIAKESRDFALAKEMLEARITAVRGEIDAVRARIADSDKSVAAAEESKAALARERDRLAAATAGLERVVVALEAGVRALLPKLPEPLGGREAIRLLADRLPKDGAAKPPSLSERFLTVVGILNETNKFARELHATRQVIPVGEGRTAEVDVLYFGLARAFYAAGGGSGGVGAPGDRGWVWTAATGAAERLVEAVAIQKGEKVAAYVRLPVQIK
jgi:hypothetical protein